MTGDKRHTGEEIILKCIQGDIKAQFRIYRMYSQAMFNIAVRLVGNRMDAEDILQESFLTAFGQMSSLKETRAFGSWLKRIVINNSISSLRSKRIFFEEADNIPEEEDQPSVDYAIDPVVIHQAIKELPEGARAVLVLYSLEGYRHREIAEMLNITESTSRTQYRRALQLLNGKLKNKIYVN